MRVNLRIGVPEEWSRSSPADARLRYAHPRCWTRVSQCVVIRRRTGDCGNIQETRDSVLGGGPVARRLWRRASLELMSGTPSRFCASLRRVLPQGRRSLSGIADSYQRISGPHSATHRSRRAGGRLVGPLGHILEQSPIDAFERQRQTPQTHTNISWC